MVTQTKKPNVEELSEFLGQARYLIGYGYVQGKDEWEVAERLFWINKRKGSNTTNVTPSSTQTTMKE
jgi:hypothetical protein